MKETHRRCNHPDHQGKRYLPVEKFHKRGRYKGRQRYDGKCKVCRNADHRKAYRENNPTRTAQWKDKQAYLRARSRAFTRLSHIVPELWEQVLGEELKKEGL